MMELTFLLRSEILPTPLSRGEARNFGLGGQVVMLVYYLRQTSTHTYKLIY